MVGRMTKAVFGVQRVKEVEHTVGHTGMFRHQAAAMKTYTHNRGVTMKNIQVIDDAKNCTYSLFAATDEEFDAIFPDGIDIEFAEDFFERVGENRGVEITREIWKRPVKKCTAQGIHGTLFYQQQYKKRYYPSKKESEMVPLGVDKLPHV